MGTAADRDELELAYTTLSPRLRRIVSRNVTAEPALIEDACQVAWSRWLVHRDRVAPASVLAWLATTATREALRMIRRQSREVPLEAPLQPGAEVIEFPARTSNPEQVLEMRERLAEVRHLPVRQQRMVWLQCLGFDYVEIGAHTGDSVRTVERQLHRAKRNLAEPS